MPLPSDHTIDDTVNELYDSVLDKASQPNQFGIVSAKSARLQAASQRRLVIAIERAAEAQDRTAVAQEHANRRMERLEKVGIGLAIIAACLGIVQISIAIWRP